jgi:S-methylmethionine-dependent homocysteine/selenocysteine methylase
VVAFPPDGVCVVSDGGLATELERRGHDLSDAGADVLALETVPDVDEGEALAAGWVADGARVVGGCCRVSPADIAELARAVTPGSRP